MGSQTEAIIAQIDIAWTRAFQKQLSSLAPSRYVLDSLNAYKNVVMQWGERGRQLTENSTAWVKWVEAGKIHESALEDYGGYSGFSELVKDIKETIKAVPKLVKKDVQAGFKVAGDVAGDVSTGVITGVVKSSIMPIIIVMAGLFIFLKTR